MSQVSRASVAESLELNVGSALCCEPWSKLAQFALGTAPVCSEKDETLNGIQRANLLPAPRPWYTSIPTSTFLQSHRWTDKQTNISEHIHRERVQRCRLGGTCSWTDSQHAPLFFFFCNHSRSCKSRGVRAPLMWAICLHWAWGRVSKYFSLSPQQGCLLLSTHLCSSITCC